MAANFSYGEYFRAGVVLGELLRSDDNPSWLTKIPSKVPKTKNLIYLGCNIFKTVHLVETLCRILDHLGIDYKAVGGPVFCCGTVPRQKGDLKMGEGMFKRTVSVFDEFEPEALVHWCPSCEEEFEFAASLNPLTTPQIHFSEFLFGLLRDRNFPNPVRRRAAMHYHGGATRADNESQHALAILRRIPGLEVETLTAPPSFGTHCSSQGAIRKLGMEGYRKTAHEQFDEVRKRNCDGIVSIYHSCHREYAKARRPDDPQVINYLTLVAQALGLDVPEDKFQRLATLNSQSLAVQELLPVAEKRGIEKTVVESVLKSQMALPAG